jgi:hypothetical protein
MAYGWGLIEGESNPWRFVKKGDSGSGSNPAKPGQASSHVPSKGGHIQPSLNSLVIESRTNVGLGRVDSKPKMSGDTHSGKPLITSLSSHFHLPSMGSHGKETRHGNHATFSGHSINGNTHRGESKKWSKEFQGSSASEALNKILKDDPIRRRFRRYLQTLKMEENIRFWDSVSVFRLDNDPHKRFVSARAIISTFVLDSSPLQVNLSSKTRQALVDAFNQNNKEILSHIDVFDTAMSELFNDLRLSDAFRQFLENDTFSSQVLDKNTKSDPTIVPLPTNGPTELVDVALVPHATMQ